MHDHTKLARNIYHSLPINVQTLGRIVHVCMQLVDAAIAQGRNSKSFHLSKNSAIVELRQLQLYFI
jgi:hypothetical protein